MKVSLLSQEEKDSTECSMINLKLLDFNGNINFMAYTAVALEQLIASYLKLENFINFFPIK